MKTLEGQLADYGARQRELHGPIASSELRSGLRVALVGSRPLPKLVPRWLVGLAVAAVTLLGFGLISLFAGSGARPDVGETLGQPSPPTTIIGIPPEGTPPSDVTPGELVLQWDGSLTVTESMWVYADGRVIWSRWPTVVDPGGSVSGLKERRLTPEGVESLRSQVMATGLFSSDLMLAREGGAPFLAIRVKNGDRLVGVTWAWRGITGDAPVPTLEQETALRALNSLLVNLGSWASWEDPTPTDFVPSQYSICFGISSADAAAGDWLGATDPTRVWALLPEPAQDILRAGAATEEDSMHQDGGCSRITTDNARALALILQEAGIPQSKDDLDLALLFSLSDQVIVSDQGVVGDQIFIQFAPVLPHGGAVWLGPG